MGIEYENIGEVIAGDVKQYLIRNELCTPDEADVLCQVYQDQPNEITSMSWWDVLGLAMKQNSYLFSFWEERAKRINVRTPHPNERRVVPGLVSAPEGLLILPNPDSSVQSLKRLTGVCNGNG
ncbi:hypothetical protein [Xanthomonas phage RTH11]|nr:hypothetical protein [Xanthomonas phage RTH11]